MTAISYGIGIHNNCWLWGPGEATGEVVIAVHESGETLRRWWRDARPARRLRL